MARDMPSQISGSLRVPFGERQVLARAAHDSTIQMTECPSCGPSHGTVIIALAIDTHAPPARALFLSLSADQAREFAAAVLDIAQELSAEHVH